MKTKRMLFTRAGAVLSAIALASLSVTPCFAVTGPLTANPTEKVETVNVATDASGAVDKVEVETTLKNGELAERLLDASTLTGIEGDDGMAYEASGDALAWQADGSDVTYSGEASEQLPVSMSVTYRLDGEEVTPQEIAGKSGVVSIRYDFANASAFPASVNGSDVEMHVPFTCITAVMLGGDVFSDVEVTNGKVVDDGSDVIVAGYAMPGLKESLGTLAEKANIPDHFEVTATAKDFELKPTMTIVTAGLMSDVDADDMGFEDLDEISSGLDEGMSRLVSGADELTSGMRALAEGAGKLHDGAGELASGAESLADGLYLLAYGEDGKSGLQGAATSADELVEGLGAVDASLAELADPKKGLPALAGGLSALADAYPDEKQVAALTKAIEASDLDERSKAALEGVLASTGRVAEVSEGLEKCSDGLTGLSGGYSEIVKQSEALPDGLAEAAKAARRLYGGAAGLSEGADQLNAATSELSAGVQGAAEGSGQLAEGLATFDEEGVSEIVSAINDDIGGFKTRLGILSDAARAYDNFGGKAPGVASSVKFVYETPAVEAG